MSIKKIIFLVKFEKRKCLCFKKIKSAIEVEKATVVWEDGQPQNIPYLKNPKLKIWLLSIKRLWMFGWILPVKALIKEEENHPNAAEKVNNFTKVKTLRLLLKK